MSLKRPRPFRAAGFKARIEGDLTRTSVPMIVVEEIPKLYAEEVPAFMEWLEKAAAWINRRVDTKLQKSEGE